jgi:hypothetical protein
LIPQNDNTVCFKAASFYMDLMMTNLSSHWNQRPSIPRFVNPFAGSIPRAPARLVVERHPAVAYGPVHNLSNFLAHYHNVADWKRAFFPGSNFTDPGLVELGVRRLSIQSWYPCFFNWVCIVTREADGLQRIKSGSHGVGKTVFGLYLIG